MCSLKLAAISNMDLPEEAHQPLSDCGRWCGKHGEHFGGVDSNAVLAHDMTEQLAIGYCECTLGGVEFEVRFTTTLQTTMQAVEMTGCGTKDYKVIQKYLHKFWDELVKYWHDRAQKSG